MPYRKHLRTLSLLTAFSLALSTFSTPSWSATKSAKRGIAYDIASPADLSALSPGISWWYNWSPKPHDRLAAYNYSSTYGVDFIPMVWNANVDDGQLKLYLQAHPDIRYLLVINEPNLVDQANMTPEATAQFWPRLEQISAQTGVKLVGPAMNWGTMSGYGDPVVWLDAFYAAYRAQNQNRDPKIDYLAFHWYDYGLSGMLDRLSKYGKPFWVTEFANWHSPIDGVQIDTLEKQKQQMAEMVAVCENRADVFRYAWFTGRMNDDPHFSSLLNEEGRLTELGQHYISLPFNQ
ncbi:glycoside hydrolase family protein [Pseudomonas quasicaspiana]|uniref:glycoside hydrolase family protein n=1 Tax=Pseudomonas quasicaspiana TaxID=2829821 RepID=UPI0029E802FF|nr:glycoside hydrolase family protein [Pseudomonas quasicaspiana]MCD5980854.1 glycoside hydrolase family protein [Pseudomonas quasicaspiana]